MPYATRDEGDMNALAIKVLPRFGVKNLTEWPLGSHVIMLHWDQETGRLISLEGFAVTQEWRDQAVEDHADTPEEAVFSSTALLVPPVTEKEARDIAWKVADRYGVETINDLKDMGRGFDAVIDMLAAAAQLGRGLDA